MAIKKPIALYDGIMKQMQDGDHTPDYLVASEAESVGERAESLARKGNGVNGGAFISNIQPQGSGNVGSKVFSSDGFVLDSCVTDTQLLTVTVLAVTGNTNYKPVVTINGTPVPLAGQVDKPLFTGTLNIDLAGATSLTVIHEDGAEHTCHITADAPPQIQTAVFTGGYPGSQTELKENDVFSLNIVNDIPITAIEVDNYGAYKAQTFNVASGLNHTVIPSIANRGTTTQDLGARVRVQKSTGSWSAWFLTASGGSADGVNLVKLNNLYPSVSFGAITYPGSQQALKNAESAIVTNTVTNFDVVSYTSPIGELTINNPSTFEANKALNRLNGNYNVATNNLRIAATRLANNATTTQNTIVKIANILPTINITVPAARLRSGGNNGTSPQNYTVTLTSSQQLLLTPALTAGAGSWQGVFGGSGVTWTRTLQISDDIIKGTYSFSSLSATNLSGMEQTVINSGANYTIGGFVARSIPLPAFANEAALNVAAAIYTKITLSWSFKPSLVNRQPLNSSPPIVDGWCLVALDVNPATIRILDTAATDSSSQESTITIEEVI